MKLLSSYWRTRNKVIKKAEFTMPSFPSTTSSTSMSNVSDLPSDFVGKLMATLVKKYDKSQQFTQNLLIGIDEKFYRWKRAKG